MYFFTSKIGETIYLEGTSGEILQTIAIIN